LPTKTTCYNMKKIIRDSQRIDRILLNVYEQIIKMEGMSKHNKHSVIHDMSIYACVLISLQSLLHASMRIINKNKNCLPNAPLHKKRGACVTITKQAYRNKFVDQHNDSRSVPSTTKRHHSWAIGFSGRHSGNPISSQSSVQPRQAPSSWGSSLVSSCWFQHKDRIGHLEYPSRRQLRQQPRISVHHVHRHKISLCKV
jgi:hypothetical protein